jgi:predicted NUDIX family phosphoesterase
MKDPYELILVTQNVPSIHYDTEDYFHFEPGVNEAWKYDILKTAHFIERWMAEQDNTILQLIPYIICVNKKGEVLRYQRKGGGEKRLEGKLSIGIGGHVNIEDLHGENDKPAWETVRAGATREVVEELGLGQSFVHENLRPLGTLYAPSDDGGKKGRVGPAVGEVHLGIIYMLEITDASLMVDEGMIDPQFIDISSAQENYNKFEAWSQLVLDQSTNILDYHEKHSHK